MSLSYYYSSEPLSLECGQVLPGFRIAYTQYGKPDEDGSNVIWILHALTANSDPVEWWPGVVGPGLPIDTNKYCVICAAAPGSPYGSTHALDLNPETGKPYFHDFPMLTNRDIVSAFDSLRLYLGLERISTIIGASLGGQQALEWIIWKKEVFSKAVLIATNAWHSPWGIAFNESQRLAIEADQTWQFSEPNAGKAGLKAARSIALLSYRTITGYNQGQSEDEHGKIDDFKASSYQRYQGDKLVNRYHAFAYYMFTKAMDSHHIGRGRGSVEQVLSSVPIDCTVIGITSDQLFPISEQEYLARYLSHAKLYKIDSPLGHDGFLTESDQIGSILAQRLFTLTQSELSLSIG